MYIIMFQNRCFRNSSSRCQDCHCSHRQTSKTHQLTDDRWRQWRKQHHTNPRGQNHVSFHRRVQHPSAERPRFLRSDLFPDRTCHASARGETCSRQQVMIVLKYNCLVQNPLNTTTTMLRVTSMRHFRKHKRRTGNGS